MSMQDGLATAGIIGVIVGLLIMVGGVVLLVFSILSTVRGKKRIGGIAFGGTMIAGSLMLMLTFGSFAITAGMMYDAPHSWTLESLGTNIITALKDKKTDDFGHLFAKKSYSGDALTKENAATVFGYIDGDVKSVGAEVIEVPFKNGTYAAQDKYTLVTEDSGKYIIYVYFIYGSEDNDYVGIQHIKMYEGTKVLCEFGKAPDLK